MAGFDFLKSVMSLNEYASVAKDGIIAGDFDGFMDSGSYALNALLSGSIYGGYPLGKITALAGPSGVGKTFFSLTAIRLFLENNPEGGVFLFESESAMTKSLLEQLKIDTSRVFIFPVETVEQFRHQALVILEKYSEQKKEERLPLLMVLDSLGMLSTEKEMADISDGKSTRDMTRAQLVKGAFRVLTLKAGKCGVPMILTNHTYKEMCLTEDTEILMEDGSFKTLSEVNIGDIVKTRNGNHPVIGKYSDEDLKNDEEMFQIEMEDGSIIECTGNHMFMRKGIWVEAKFLKQEDGLLCVFNKKEFNSSVKIKNIKKIERKRVADITVDNEHEFILKNGVVSHNSLFPKTVMSGGTGIQYAASTIVILGKKQDKEGNEIVGNIIPCKIDKGRLTRERSMVETAINYENGLSRWHGMIELAVEGKIWKKLTGAKIDLRNGEDSVKIQAIKDSPEEFFTQEVLDKIDAFCKTHFLYGSAQEDLQEEITEEENVEN